MPAASHPESGSSNKAPSDGDPAISWPLPTSHEPNQWDVDTDLEYPIQRAQARPYAHDSAPLSSYSYLPPSLYPGEVRSQSGIAIRAFCLGITLGASVALTVYFAFVQNARIWRTFFYLATLSLFHYLEFWTHAQYNLPEATIATFLLSTNGLAYNIANGTALLETTITSLIFQDWQARWASRTAIALGMVLIVIGQMTRSTAMAQAGTNFNHHVQRMKRDDHVLVKTGVYAYLRHPSYFGFYYWAVGTQMVIGNFFSGIAIGLVLWVFFNRRIRIEEALLVDFFGEDYVQYRSRTRTFLPFIGITISDRIKLFMHGGAPARAPKVDSSKVS